MHPESYTLRARRSYVPTEMEACTKALTLTTGAMPTNMEDQGVLLFLSWRQQQNNTRAYMSFLCEAFTVKIT